MLTYCIYLMRCFSFNFCYKLFSARKTWVQPHLKPEHGKISGIEHLETLTAQHDCKSSLLHQHNRNIFHVSITHFATSWYTKETQVFNLKKIYICQSGPALNDISNLKINADISYKVTVMNGFGFSPSVHECIKTSPKTKFNYCHLMEILMWASAASEILAFSARQQGKSSKHLETFKCITMQPLTGPWLRIMLTKCQSWWITLCDASLWSSFLKPYWDPVEKQLAVTARKRTHQSKSIWAQVKQVKGRGWEVKEAQLVRCTVSCRWSLEHRQLASRWAGLRRSCVRAQRLHSFMSNHV